MYYVIIDIDTLNGNLKPSTLTASQFFAFASALRAVKLGAANKAKRPRTFDRQPKLPRPNDLLGEPVWCYNRSG